MVFKKINSVLLLRISLGSAIFFLSILVLLCLTAQQMGKKLEVVAQFFPTTQNASILYEFSQLNRLVPFKAINDKKRINEMLVRYYLEMRYTQIQDTYEMTYRWGYGGPVYRLSSPLVYVNFAKKLERRLEGLPDVVKTIDIKNIKVQGNVFEVDFIVYENFPEGQIRLEKKRATLEYVYASFRRSLSSVYGNPYGMMFIRFEEKTFQN